MSKGSLDQGLFEEFSATDLQAWLENVERDLKGKPLEKLNWKTESNLEMKPFYRFAPFQNPYITAVPGRYPFRRGDQLNKESKAWQIVQEISVEGENPEARIQEAQAVGVFALKLRPHGRSVATDTAYRPAFRAIQTNSHALHLFGDAVGKVSLFAALDAELKEQQPDPGNLTGCYFHAETINPTLEGMWDRQAELIDRFADAYPNMRLLGIDLGELAESGANPVQQIAYGLALTVEAIEAMAERGISTEQTLLQIAFSIAIGSSFFVEVGKLRAFRLVYAHLLTAYEVKEPEAFMPFVLANGMRWNQARYDKHTNMLRATTEAVGAIAGGCHALSIPAYDQVSQPEDASSARWARNIQLLLQHEAYLDQVKDPGGGAYYLETLTDQQAEAAWKQFQEIESKGGYTACYPDMSQSILQGQLDRQKLVARQQKILVGVNKYPNIGEVMLPSDDSMGAGDLFQPIGGEQLRGAARFEMIREQVDRMGQQRGRRLTACLVLWGDLRMRKARAQFARNMIGSAGFDVYEVIVEESVDAASLDFGDRVPDLIICCSADSDYAESGEDQIASLRSKMASLPIVLAGKSPETDSFPVDGFLYVGMDAIDFFEQILPLALIG